MRICILCLSLAFIVLFTLSSTQVKAQVSITELDPSNIVTSPDIPNSAQVIRLNGLTIFNDESQFNSICTSLPLEDFGNTIVPPNEAVNCPGPINSSTNDNCFTPGAVIDGFTFSGIPNGENGSLAVVTPTAFGVTSVVVGADFFVDNNEITFQNGGASAVGAEVFGLLGLTSVQVDIFGTGNELLGTTSVATSPNGVFFGVISETPITRITFTNGEADFYTNLTFGDCALTNIPTLSEWGMIAMAGVLGIIALLVIRRRKATA
jgi:hypothetical protein